MRLRWAGGIAGLTMNVLICLRCDIVAGYERSAAVGVEKVSTACQALPGLRGILRVDLRQNTTGQHRNAIYSASC